MANARQPGRLRSFFRNYHVQSLIIAIIFALVAVGVLLWIESLDTPYSNQLWLGFLIIELVLYFLYEKYLGKGPDDE